MFYVISEGVSGEASDPWQHVRKARAVGGLGSYGPRSCGSREPDASLIRTSDALTPCHHRVGTDPNNFTIRSHLPEAARNIMDDEDIARYCPSSCSPVVPYPHSCSHSRAIALSLLDGPPARRAPQPEIITIDDDDEEPENSDEPFQSELQRALQLSAAEASTTRGPKTIPAMRPTTPPAAAPTAPPGAPPVGPSLQSERAQMERERLERLKRLRPDLIDNSGANTGGQRKRGRDGDTETDESEVDEDTRPGAKRHRVSPPAASRPRVDGGAGRRDEYATASAPGEQLFWDGELRQTANALADAAKDTRPTFRLTEIIGKVSATCPICIRR